MIKSIKRIIKRILLPIANIYGKYIRPIHIMNSLDTIEYIKKNRVSVSRFGDGEFVLCFKEREIVFQKESNALSEALTKVLKSTNDNLLVCVPEAINIREGLTDSARDFWEDFFSIRKIKILNQLKKKRIYGNASFTRPYMDSLDKTKSRDVFSTLMELFKGEDLLIIEGDQTFSGIGNDLFKKASSIERIICPSKNAYSEYDRILKAIKKYGKNKLCLISLGPTATVLAHDLSIDATHNYWAIDLGHLDLEYEWYKNSCQYKTSIHGRSVAETGNFSSETLNENDLVEYNAQIVCRV